MTKYYPFPLLCNMVAHLKEQKNSIMFVHGMFDLLHEGHLHMLYKAKKLADVVVVGLDCDLIATRVKGKDRPLRKFNERCFILSQVETVDFIFKVQCKNEHEALDDIYENIYENLKPDFVATNVKAGKHGPIKKARAEVYDIQFIDIQTSKKATEVTTTSLLNQFKNKI